MTDSRPRAIVRVTRTQIEVSCRYTVSWLPVVEGTDRRDQITKATFAHERRCGRDRCDTSRAYQQGDPTFTPDLRAATHYTQDQLELRKRAS